MWLKMPTQDQYAISIVSSIITILLSLFIVLFTIMGLRSSPNVTMLLSGTLIAVGLIIVLQVLWLLDDARCYGEMDLPSPVLEIHESANLIRRVFRGKSGPVFNGILLQANAIVATADKLHGNIQFLSALEVHSETEKCSIQTRISELEAILGEQRTALERMAMATIEHCHVGDELALMATVEEANATTSALRDVYKGNGCRIITPKAEAKP
jgi:hypothetical protein